MLKPMILTFYDLDVLRKGNVTIKAPPSFHIHSASVNADAGCDAFLHHSYTIFFFNKLRETILILTSPKFSLHLFPTGFDSEMLPPLCVSKGTSDVNVEQKNRDLYK